MVRKEHVCSPFPSFSLHSMLTFCSFLPYFQATLASCRFGWPGRYITKTKKTAEVENETAKDG